MVKPIIGFRGPMGAGKDTAARIVLDHKGGYHREAFADQVRLEVYNALYPPTFNDVSYPTWDEFLAFCEESKRRDPQSQEGAMRLLLQGWGMLKRHLHGNDYWIKKMPFGDGALITDVRFPEEEDAIRARGGVIVAVLPLWKKEWETTAIVHVSENALVGRSPDFYLPNYGDMDSFTNGVLVLTDAIEENYGARAG